MRKAESDLKLSGVLVFAYGNPGRLDDGLGPALAAQLEKRNFTGVTVDSNYQLSVEDAELVSRHSAVIFVDASVNGPEPFGVQHIVPDNTCSFSTHSVSPAQVMGLAEELFHRSPPGFIVGIRGYEFNEFAEKLSAQAASNLKETFEFMDNLLSNWDMTKLETMATQHIPVPPAVRKEEDNGQN